MCMCVCGGGNTGCRDASARSLEPFPKSSGWRGCRPPPWLPSIRTGFPEEPPGMGARKWLDRWGVGGSSQHMGPRGREESGPGRGVGRRAGGRERPGLPRRSVPGAGTRADGRWGGRAIRPERGGGNPPKRGGGLAGAHPGSLRGTQQAPRPAQGRPLPAPLASTRVPFSPKFRFRESLMGRLRGARPCLGAQSCCRAFFPTRAREA